MIMNIGARLQWPAFLLGGGFIVTVTTFGITAARPTEQITFRSPPAPPAVVSSDEALARGKTLFFGYVEFDWDGTAPEGVPGFGSMPPAATPVEVASVN
jgi:hypothetical protein